MQYSLSFPTPLHEAHPRNDNIDVCLRLEDGRTYTFVAATPENLRFLMEKDNLSFWDPGAPFLIVESIRESSIRQAVEAIIDNDELLQLYGGNGTQ